jgi:hypothetical protein
MYEIQISYVTVDSKGNDRNTKENLILEHAESFADAEQIGYDYGSGLTGLDVVAIKRSKIKEIANERTSDDEKIFLATLVDVFLNEDGTEKEMKYTIAFFSKSMASANAYINEYAKQGYNMSITKIVESKYDDVLK